MAIGLEIEEVSNLLGVPVDAINNYRRRYDLFPDVETSRGRSAIYGFTAVLRLKAVQRLVSLGLSPSMACRIISKAPDLTELFHARKALEFGVSPLGAVIHNGFDDFDDTVVSVPIHGDGAHILVAMSEKISERYGPETAEKFRRGVQPERCA